MPSKQKMNIGPYPEYTKVTLRIPRTQKAYVGETREIYFKAYADFGDDNDWRDGVVSVMRPDGSMAKTEEAVSPTDHNVYSTFVEFSVPGVWEILFEYGHGSKAEESLLHKVYIRAV